MRSCSTSFFPTPRDIDLTQIRKLQPDVPIIMLTANAYEELTREKRGALDYIVSHSTCGISRVCLQRRYRPSLPSALADR
jgi:hypothetical protein